MLDKVVRNLRRLRDEINTLSQADKCKLVREICGILQALVQEEVILQEKQQELAECVVIACERAIRNGFIREAEFLDHLTKELRIPENQLFGRLCLCEALLKAPRNVSDGVSSLEESVVHINLCLEFGQKHGPRYEFLVHNSSIVYWQIVRQFWKPGWRMHMTTSLKRIVDALWNTRTPHPEWLGILIMNLVEAFMEAGQPENAKEYIKKGMKMSQVQAPHLYHKLFGMWVEYQLGNTDELNKVYNAASTPGSNMVVGSPSVRSSPSTAQLGERATETDIDRTLERLQGDVRGTNQFVSAKIHQLKRLLRAANRTTTSGLTSSAQQQRTTIVAIQPTATTATSNLASADVEQLIDVHLPSAPPATSVSRSRLGRGGKYADGADVRRLLFEILYAIAQQKVAYATQVENLYNAAASSGASPLITASGGNRPLTSYQHTPTPAFTITDDQRAAQTLAQHPAAEHKPVPSAPVSMQLLAERKSRVIRAQQSTINLFSLRTLEANDALKKYANISSFKLHHHLSSSTRGLWARMDSTTQQQIAASDITQRTLVREFLLEVGYIATSFKQFDIARRCISLELEDAMYWRFSLFEFELLEILLASSDLEQAVLMHRGGGDASVNNKDSILSKRFDIFHRAVGMMNTITVATQQQSTQQQQQLTTTTITHDANIVQAAAVTLWNVAQPLLQSGLRKNLLRPFLRAAELLRKYESPYGGLIGQLYWEIAKCEEDVDHIENAIEYLEEALKFRDQCIYAENIEDDLERLECRKDADPSSQDPAHRAMTQLEHFAENASGLDVSPFLIQAGNLLTDGQFSRLVQGEKLVCYYLAECQHLNEAMLGQVALLYCQLVNKPLNAIETNRSYNSSVKTTADRVNESEQQKGIATNDTPYGNLNIWWRLVQLAKQNGAQSVCRMAAGVCVRIDDPRVVDNTEFFKLAVVVPGATNNDQPQQQGEPAILNGAANASHRVSQQEQQQQKINLQHHHRFRDILRMMAEIRIIHAETLSWLLASVGACIKREPELLIKWTSTVAKTYNTNARSPLLLNFQQTAVQRAEQLQSNQTTVGAAAAVAVHAWKKKQKRLQERAQCRNSVGAHRRHTDGRWSLFKRWFDDISTAALNSLVRACNLAAKLKMPHLFHSATTCLLELCDPVIAAKRQKDILPELEIFWLQAREFGTSIAASNANVHGLLSNAYAKALAEKAVQVEKQFQRNRPKLTDNQQVAAAVQQLTVSAKDKQQQKTGSNKKVTKNMPVSSPTSLNAPDSLEAIDLFRRAREVCQLALTTIGTDIALNLRSQLLETWVEVNIALADGPLMLIDAPVLRNSENEKAFSIGYIVAALHAIGLTGQPPQRDNVTPTTGTSQRPVNASVTLAGASISCGEGGGSRPLNTTNAVNVNELPNLQSVLDKLVALQKSCSEDESDLVVRMLFLCWFKLALTAFRTGRFDGVGNIQSREHIIDIACVETLRLGNLMLQNDTANNARSSPVGTKSNSKSNLDRECSRIMCQVLLCQVSKILSSAASRRASYAALQPLVQALCYAFKSGDFVLYCHAFFAAWDAARPLMDAREESPTLRNSESQKSMRHTLLVIIGLTGYMMRNVVDIREARKAFTDFDRWQEYQSQLSKLVIATANTNNKNERLLQSRLKRKLRNMQTLNRLLNFLVDLAAVVLQSYDDEESYLAGLETFNQICTTLLPPTYHQIRLKLYQMVFKARLGHSIKHELEQFREDNNAALVHSLWYRLARSSSSVYSRTTAQKNDDAKENDIRMIAFDNALITSPTMWKAYEILFVFVDWLLKRNYPKELALAQMHRAVDLVVKNRSFERHLIAASGGSDVKTAKRINDHTVSSNNYPQKKDHSPSSSRQQRYDESPEFVRRPTLADVVFQFNESSPHSSGSTENRKFGFEPTTATFPEYVESEQSPVKRMDFLARAYVVLAIMSKHSLMDHFNYCMLAAEAVMKLLQICITAYNNIVDVRSKFGLSEKPVGENAQDLGHFKYNINEEAGVEPREAPLQKIMFPRSVGQWFKFRLPPQAVRILNNDDTVKWMTISPTTINDGQSTVFYMLRLTTMLCQAYQHHLALPVAVVAETVGECLQLKPSVKTAAVMQKLSIGCAMNLCKEREIVLVTAQRQELLLLDIANVRENVNLQMEGQFINSNISQSPWQQAFSEFYRTKQDFPPELATLLSKADSSESASGRLPMSQNATLGNQETRAHTLPVKPGSYHYGGYHHHYH